MSTYTEKFQVWLDGKYVCDFDTHTSTEEDGLATVLPCVDGGQIFLRLKHADGGVTDLWPHVMSAGEASAHCHEMIWQRALPGIEIRKVDAPADLPGPVEDDGA